MQIQRYSLSGPVSKPLNIALVADLHDRDGSAILSSLTTEKPDIIAIAGDLTNNLPGTKEGFPAFISACSRIAPTFYALGNHEFSFTEADIALARESGAVVLVDEYVSLGSVCIGGLTSRTRPARLSHRRKTVPPRLDWLSDLERQSGFKILINHHPEYYRPYLKERDIDLILSGHAHGGQMRFFGRGLFAPGQGVLPRYTKGIYDGRLVVSAGLANTVRWLPRWGNPTELVYIKINPQT